MSKKLSVKLKKVDEIPPPRRGMYWDLAYELMQAPNEWREAEIEGGEKAINRVYSAFRKPTSSLPVSTDQFEATIRDGKLYLRYIDEGQHVA